MQTTTYKLDITPGGVPLTIHISQYDVGLRQYTFQPFTSVGEFAYVPGATVTLEATKPDGYAVIHDCTYSSDGTITYTVQEQLAAKPGKVWSKIVIRVDNDVLGTGTIVWLVDEAGVKDSAIVSESDVSGIHGMVDAEVKNAMFSFLPTESTNGAIAHFEDGADDIPVKDLKIGIVPQQSGSGDPSPTNIRPITGWMGATVTRAGKNLINDSIKTVQSASTCVIGQTSTSEFNIYLPAGTYTVSFGSSKAPGVYYRLSTESSGSHNVITYGNKTGSFTLTANAHLRIWAYLSGGITPSDIEWFQIEYGSTATTYKPYTASTYSISFGSAGTVYGGTLDVTTGVLTADRIAVILTADMGWTQYGSSGSGLRYAITLNPLGPTAFALAEMICSHATYLSGNNGNFGTFNLYNNVFMMKDNNAVLGSINSFKSYLSSQISANTPVTISYKLAAPITYQLTPTEVRTLLGINNIWSDTGDAEVEYKADAQAYMDKRITATKSIIAGIETEYKATKNYTTGQFLIVGDNLYKVTANIASGATIAVGTNVVSTTVAEQLIALANA